MWIELTIYIQDTRVYTSLVIEGEKYQNGTHYDFYKQTFYPHYSNRITVYGEHLASVQLIERVEIYLTNRRKELKLMNFGQNLYNCFFTNAQSLVLLATV